MTKLDKVVINGIDVTDYRLDVYVVGEWQIAIDTATVSLFSSVNTILDITSGMDIQIYRGFVTSTDEIIFNGQITQVTKSAVYINLNCKNPIYDAIKSSKTKSWDKDIDVSLGIGSEIFKSICDHSQLAYTPPLNDYTDGSIYFTGNEDSNKIVKFIQNDEDDYQKMLELAQIYNRIITYDYTTSLVNFKTKGYTVYPIPLNVGYEIPGQIKWKYNMEQLINQVKIQGATVYDKRVETFAGPATTYTLTYAPEDTEVRINSTTTNNLMKRGQKDVGVLGTDFDYYVDVEQKKIVFLNNKSNVWINYGAQVPLPIILSNISSIDTYGGPNKIPHFKKFAFTDIKDIADAEARGRAILDQYSIPFIEAQSIPVLDSVIETYGTIQPGMLVNIIDSFNNLNLTLFVRSVEKTFPQPNDNITVGDQIWRTEDWQADQMKKINLLFNELNKNQNILYQIFDFSRNIQYERRYMMLERTDLTDAGGIILDSNLHGGLDGLYGLDNLPNYSGVILDNDLYGGFDDITSGFDGTGAAADLAKITQYNNTYKEFIYDTDFFDTDSTGAWNTTTKTITLTPGQVLLTKCISRGTLHTYETISFGSISGTYTLEISANNKQSWQTITKDIRTILSSSDSTGVYIRITNTGLTDVVIQNTYNSGGSYNLPAIQCILEE